jgi:hypothetical protein
VLVSTCFKNKIRKKTLKKSFNKPIVLLLSVFLFSSLAEAFSIPVPVNIKCQEGEEVVYVPLVKGGAPLVPKCMADM